MAAARIKGKRRTDTVRTEFHVPLNRLLTEFLDPQDVQPTDKWSVITNGTGDGFIIMRERETITDIPE